MNSGNSWEYSAIGGNVIYEVDENLKKFDGRDLMVIKSPGMEEYFGFVEKTLKQYGFFQEDVGNIIFSPPIILGGDSILQGSRYNTYSGIICEKYPDIRGTLQENLNFVERINKMSINGNPYGDCWKMNEDFTMEIGKSDRYNNAFFL